MKNNIKHILFAFTAAALIYACKPAEGDHPGSEYMPDMGHSIAYEANTYTHYGLNTWDSASTFRLKELTNPRLPVDGSVPRGYAGIYFAQQRGGEDAQAVMDQLNGKGDVNNIAVPENGHVPYYYEDSEAERTRATEEIIENPFPITAEGLEKGEELYNIFCAICHGETGNGMGYIASDDNPNKKYPAVPANLLLDDYVYSSNGRYYHALMYGKNLMGAYKDKINYEERWQVIHWVRHLQAQDKELKYNENANTLEPSFGTPFSQIEQMATVEEGLETPGEINEPSAEGESVSDDHGGMSTQGGGGK